MGTPASDGHESSGYGALIELPDLLQNLGQGRRSGSLTITGSGGQRSLHLVDGVVVAVTRPSHGALYRGLLWVGLLAPRSLEGQIAGDPTRMADEDLAQRLIAKGLVPEDGIRDAIDCLIEEAVTTILGWQDIRPEFIADQPLTGWASYQQQLGTRIPTSAVLMESLRRQDELKRVADSIPGRWDVLLRDAGLLKAGLQLSESAQRMLKMLVDGRPFGALADVCAMPPWEARFTAGLLVQQGMLRLADSNELLMYADRSRSSGHIRMAEGLYRRALERGAAASRIHVAMAELAERRGDETQAATDYLAAAELLEGENPSEAVLALRNAMRLGADRAACLNQLEQIYERLDEAEDAIDVLFQLAQFHEEHDQIPDAIEAVRSALRLGADPVRCSQVIAALALLIDRTDEALLQLEYMVQAADDAGRDDEAFTARRQVLRLAPGRVVIAVSVVERMRQGGRDDEAASIASAAIAAAPADAPERQVLKLREHLAELRPDDVANHQELAKAYQHAKDRDGASRQLALMADAQEREGQDADLAVTLDRIVALGNSDVVTLVRLAQVNVRLDHERAAADAWLRAVDEAMAQGDGATARQQVEAALAELPTYPGLHLRLGQLAARGGELELATTAFRNAADLARITGDERVAQQAMSQALAQQPDDLALRLQAVDMAVARGGDDVDQRLAGLIRFASEQHNLGLALTRSRQRVELAAMPAFEQRLELVDLLRRCRRHQEELSQGRRLHNELSRAGHHDQALQLLEDLSRSHSEHADLAADLGDALMAADQAKAAAGAYRHAVTLFQQQDRNNDARRVLQRLAEGGGDHDEVNRALELLEMGQAINWQVIRDQRAVAQKEAILRETTGRRQSRPNLAPVKVKPISRQPSSSEIKGLDDDALERNG